ncbi:hypothetical protein D3C86_2123570 [compost metagenome]
MDTPTSVVAAAVRSMLPAALMTFRLVRPVMVEESTVTPAAAALSMETTSTLDRLPRVMVPLL